MNVTNSSRSFFSRIFNNDSRAPDANQLQILALVDGLHLVRTHEDLTHICPGYTQHTESKNDINLPNTSSQTLPHIVKTITGWKKYQEYCVKLNYCASILIPILEKERENLITRSDVYTVKALEHYMNKFIGSSPETKTYCLAYNQIDPNKYLSAPSSCSTIKSLFASYGITTSKSANDGHTVHNLYGNMDHHFEKIPYDNKYVEEWEHPGDQVITSRGGSGQVYHINTIKTCIKTYFEEQNNHTQVSVDESKEEEEEKK